MKPPPAVLALGERLARRNAQPPPAHLIAAAAGALADAGHLPNEFADEGTQNAAALAVDYLLRAVEALKGAS